MEVRKFLLESNVYPNLNGFDYVIAAVEMVKKEGKISTTKQLYPGIAKQFNTTSSKVERAIRFIVSTKINSKTYDKLGFRKKPTNSEFIYYFAKQGEKNNEKLF